MSITSGSLLKLSGYYAVITLVLAIIAQAFPEFMDHLPIGGVGDMASHTIAVPTVDAFQEVVETTVAQDQFSEAIDLSIGLVGALLLMLPVVGVYQATHLKCNRDYGLMQTIMLLPLIVSSVVLIVQHSLALAFSLAGIVAGVQFRRSLKATSDSLFIFTAIAVGLATGIKALEIAMIVSIVFNYTALISSAAGYGACEAMQVPEPEDETPQKKKKKKTKRPIAEPSTTLARQTISAEPKPSLPGKPDGVAG